VSEEVAERRENWRRNTSVVQAGRHSGMTNGFINQKADEEHVKIIVTI
jgi:hypothetical protein